MVNSQSSMVNKIQVVFFGTGPYVISIIETLNETFDLALVVTTEKNGAVVSHCKAKNIEYQSVSSLSIVNGQLSMVNCRIAVLASFGLIIPDEILNMFELGILNVHPSLLPKYRGATPGQAAILNGDTITGVSIIKLDEEVDHGPILAQIEQPIEQNDTSDILYSRLFKLGAKLLDQILPKYISGELISREQNHGKATFTDRLTRESGRIDLNSQLSIINSQLLPRMIRAYYPWPTVWFRYQCKPSQREGSLLNGKIIKLFPEGRIQVEGKNIMQLRDFANGYPEGQLILSQLSLS